MKILIIFASGIGNSVMFSPTLATLRKRYPEAQIDIFAYKKNFAEPFSESDQINKIINYEGLKTISELRKEKYDLSITAFPSNKWEFNLFAYLVHAKKRITHSYNIGKIITLSFLQNTKIPAVDNLHDVEQNLNLLKMLNIDSPKKIALSFFISQANQKFAEKFIRKNNLIGRNLIGVHPGSGPLRYKRAPLDAFRDLVKKNYEKGAEVLIFGGPEEKQIKEELKRKLPYDSILIEANLKNTAALIKKCKVFITNDTGLMHIASTNPKTKVIALFNGTNPKRTRPYTKNSEIIVLKPNKLKYPFRSTRA